MDDRHRDVALFRYSLIRVRPTSAERGLCRARDYAEPWLSEPRLTRSGGWALFDDSA